MEMQFLEQQEQISGPHLVVYPDHRAIRGIAIGWAIAAVFGLLPLSLLIVVMGFNTLIHTTINGSLILTELSYILNVWLAFRRSTSDAPTLVANQKGLLLHNGMGKHHTILPWSNIKKIETKRNKTLIINLRERPSKAQGRYWLNGRTYILSEESLDRPANELLRQLHETYEQELKNYGVRL
ncbi:MAG TPA: hypothetical protein VGM01_08560 [Ktedonobacteraceae bacterium]